MIFKPSPSDCRVWPMRWLVLGLFVGCTPSCAAVQGVVDWFSSPEGAVEVGTGVLDVLSGDYVGGTLQILGGLGLLGLGWKGRKIPGAMMRRRREHRDAQAILEATKRSVGDG